MSYTHSVPYLSIATHLSFFGTGAARAMGISPNGGGGSTTWPASNRAIYNPFYIPWWYPIKRMFWNNGSSTTGSADIGIYSVTGTLLTSTGTTTKSGASSIQYVSHNYLLPPGSYYLGLVMSATTNATDTIGGSWTTAAARACGMLQENLGSTVLPNTMNPAQYTATIIPMCGFTMEP